MKLFKTWPLFAVLLLTHGHSKSEREISYDFFFMNNKSGKIIHIENRKLFLDTVYNFSKICEKLGLDKKEVSLDYLFISPSNFQPTGKSFICRVNFDSLVAPTRLAFFGFPEMASTRDAGLELNWEGDTKRFKVKGNCIVWVKGNLISKSFTQPRIHLESIVEFNEDAIKNKKEIAVQIGEVGKGEVLKFETLDFQEMPYLESGRPALIIGRATRFKGFEVEEAVQKKAKP
jgi:hypothetical protein